MLFQTAVILAGGAGLRLRPLTNDRPKAMVEVAGRPLLEWVLLWLKKNGIRSVIIGIAYKGDKLTEHFRDGKSFGLDVEYSRHTVEGGTAEGFRLAIERHVRDDSFLALNGDELTDVKLEELAAFHRQERATASIAVAPLRSPFGVVEIDKHDVVRFREKPILDSVYVSIGVYAFQHQILDYLPKSGEIETTAFPRLAQERRLKAYRHDGFWRTINTLKDLDEVEKEILRGGF